MAFLKAGLVQVCARPPSPGSEPFYSKTMHKYKKLHNFEVEPLGVCSIFFERHMSWLYACNTLFYMVETLEQNNQHHFEEIKHFL
jgi:hypothetical protein